MQSSACHGPACGSARAAARSRSSQARQVRARLAAAHGVAPEQIEIEVIRTTRRRDPDRPLAEAGGKGLFTKEIEEALLAGAIDLAVHSAKDMPTVLPEGLAIAAALPREDARDVFISRKRATLRDLPRRRGRRHRVAAPAGAGEAAASRSRGGDVPRQRRDAAAQARRRRGRRHAAGARRARSGSGSPMPRPRCWRPRSSCRRSGRASSRSRRAPTTARTRALLAAVDHAATRGRARRRARLPRRARRLLPHADRRPCHGCAMAALRFAA